MTLSPAHQYTRCIVALTLTTATMEILTPELENTPLKANVQRINRWLAECRDNFPQRKLSAGATRDMKAAINIMADYAESHATTYEEIVAQWAANLWAAYTMVVDCRITCKEFTDMPCWTWLECTMETMCMKLEQSIPEAEEIGTQIYMEVA